MSDLALTLQRMLRWKDGGARGSPTPLNAEAEQLCAELLISGFEAFFPTVAERVATVHALSRQALRSDVRPGAAKASVAYALEALARRYDAAASATIGTGLDAALAASPASSRPGILFAEPDSSITSVGVLEQIQSLLLQVARSDWHAVAEAASLAPDVAAALPRKQRPRGRTVQPIASHTNFLAVFFSQVYASLQWAENAAADGALSANSASAAASEAAPSALASAAALVPSSSTLPLFFQLFHSLFLHCIDLLDYVQHVDSVCAAAAGTVSGGASSPSRRNISFHESQLARLLHFSLPLLTRALQRLSEGADDALCWSSAQVGDLVQSALSLLCRIGAAHERESQAVAPTLLAAASLPAAFRGRQLRSMLSVLLNSHQFTTTVFRSDSGSGGGGAGESKLHNILVPFAQRVLTGLFFHFARTSRSRLLLNTPSGDGHRAAVPLEAVTMNRDEFCAFYARCNAPVTLPSVMGATAAALTAPQQFTPMVHSTATNASVPVVITPAAGSSGAALGAAAPASVSSSFLLPAAPVPLHRSHTAATPLSAALPLPGGGVAGTSRPPSSSGAPQSHQGLALALVPASAAQFQAIAEFRKALKCAPSSSSGQTDTPTVEHVPSSQAQLSLDAFLQWNLRDFEHNARAKMEQLRHFYESAAADDDAAWADEDDEVEIAMEKKDAEESKSHDDQSGRTGPPRVATGSLLQELLSAYSTLLRQQVYPIQTLAVHPAASAAATAKTAEVGASPAVARDDMAMLHPTISTPLVPRTPANAQGAAAASASSSAAAAASAQAAASAAAVAALDELVPRLLDSESRWMHHPLHGVFLAFLDKFAQQTDPNTTSSTAAAAGSGSAASKKPLPMTSAGTTTPSALQQLRAPVAVAAARLSAAAMEDASMATATTMPFQAKVDTKAWLAPPAAVPVLPPSAGKVPTATTLIAAHADTPMLPSPTTTEEALKLAPASSPSPSAESKVNSDANDGEQKSDDVGESKPQSSSTAKGPTHLAVPAADSAPPMTPLPAPSPMVPEQLSSHQQQQRSGPSVSTTASAPSSMMTATTSGSSEFPGGELEEPARCLSSLFLRCLSEMGGGSAKKKVEGWKDALRAEKAFAAACIKHNGLSEEVAQYSGSVAAVELLRLALSVHPLTGLPRVRLLSHPTCPQWLKAVVQSTFAEVRSPLLQIMRAIEEEEEVLNEPPPSTSSPDLSAPASTTASSNVTFASGSVTVKLLPRTLAGKKALKSLRRLAAQSRVLVQRVLTNSLFLVRELEATAATASSGTAPPIGASPPPLQQQQQRSLDASASPNSSPSASPIPEEDNDDAGVDDDNEEDSEADTEDEEDDGDEDGDQVSEQQLVSFAPPTTGIGSLTMPTRYRTVAGAASSASQSNPRPASPALKTLASAPTNAGSSIPFPAHLQHAAAFHSDSTSRHSQRRQKHMHGPHLARTTASDVSSSMSGGKPVYLMHPSASAATLENHASSSETPASRTTAAADTSALPASNSATGAGSGPTPAPSLLERQHSEIVRRRRHSVLTISPAMVDPTGATGGERSSDAEDGAGAAGAPGVTASNISSYLRTQGSEQLGAPLQAGGGGGALGTSLWSSWSSSASRTTGGGGGGRAPYDAKWLSKLVHCGAEPTAALSSGSGTAAPRGVSLKTPPSLRDLMHPSIHRFQSVCLLRVRLLSSLNQCFTVGFGTPIVEHVFPLLVDCMERYAATRDAHLLHYGKLILNRQQRSAAGGGATSHTPLLLHFYKHLVNAINSQLAAAPASADMATGTTSSPSTPLRHSSDGIASSAESSAMLTTTTLAPVSYSDPAWLRVRSCLQLLRLDFLAEDTESIVGSGVFAALFRTIQHIDASIQAVAAADAAAASVPLRTRGDTASSGASGVSASPPMIGSGGFGRMPSLQLDAAETGPMTSSSANGRSLSAFPAPVVRSSVASQSSPTVLPSAPTMAPATSAAASSSMPPAASSASACDAALPITLRCASAYHLKFQCWQTLKFLTLFVLAQQQRRGGGSAGAQTSGGSSGAAAGNTTSASSSSNPNVNANTVLLSSVARQFVEMIVHQLSVMAAAPPKLPLQHEDGSLMYTMDCARILCQFTRLKSVCNALQLQQLLHLSTAAPAAIQTVLVQFIAAELHRISPTDLDASASLVTESSPAGSPRSSRSGVIASSASVAAHVVQQMLARIGQRLVANTVLPSVCQLDATSTSAPLASAGLTPSSRQQSVNNSYLTVLSPVFVGRPSINHYAGAASPIDGRANPAFSYPLSLSASAEQHSRETSAPAGPAAGSGRTVSASPLPPSSEDAVSNSRPPFWHESGYQSWRFYPHFHAANASGHGQGGESALVEELITALRSLATDKQWRSVVLTQVQNYMLQLPGTM
jgi:hypothetical protein